MSLMKNLKTTLHIVIYVLRNAGILHTLTYILTLPVRYILRFENSLFKLKSDIRSHLMIHERISKSNIHKLHHLPDELRIEIKDLFKKYRLPAHVTLHRFFITLNGIEKPGYLSESVFYCSFEPRLNNFSMASAYSDKNIYQRIFEYVKQPGTVLRYMNGQYFDAKYSVLTPENAQELLSSQNTPMIIKPAVNSGGGRNVYRLNAMNGRLKLNESVVSINTLSDVYENGFIVQEKVNQHPVLDAFHPNSLNTLRIITLRRSQEIFILSSRFKMGNCGNHLDNLSSSGLSCGIHKNGDLFPFAYNRYFKKFTAHPQTGVRFSGKSLPGFQDVKKTVVQMHRSLPYFDMISWDVAIDANAEPVLIELNLRGQGIIIQQALFGPLFGKLTNEMFERVLN